MALSDLPLLNACLNGASAVLLSIGYAQIRKQRIIAHRNCMISAFITSTLFLISYLYYHAHVKTTHFVDPPWFRPIYLTLLLTHTILAAVIVPMVLITLSRALKQRFDRHKAIARWTWPIWMYVSITGVVIYLILYQIFPQRR
jgi:putative membrane protein